MIWDLHSEEPGVCLGLTYASYGMDSGYVVAHHTRWRKYWKNWGTGHDTTVLRRLSFCCMWDNIQSLFEFTLHADCAPP